MHVLQYSLGLVLAIAMIVLLFLLIRPNPSQQAPPESAQPVLFMQGGNNSHEVDDSSSAYNSPEVSELENLIPSDCVVPRYAPYASVERITNNSIEVRMVDPNESIAKVNGYKVYYWGHKLTPKGKLITNEMDYGQQHFKKGGPYVLTGLKSAYSYCADFTALSQCGHGPFCMSCFENVVVL